MISVVLALLLSIPINIRVHQNVAAPCASEALRTTGTIYYVCECQTGASAGCVAGNDANAGTSKAAPWRSWAKAIAKYKTMAGGDTIAMCRGGAWTQVAGTCGIDAGNGYSSAVTILNANCTATATCDWRDYDPSPAFTATAKPIVRPMDGVEVFAFGKSRFNANGYTATPIKGFRVLNLDLAANSNGASKAFKVYGKTEDLEICNVTARDGFNPVYQGTTTSTTKRVTFRHNRVTNNPFGIGSMYGTVCAEDCTVDSNYFDLSGGPTNRDHTVYSGASPDPVGQFPDQYCDTLGCYITAQRYKISNNEIYRSAFGVGGVACGGSALVFHEPQDDTIIENNLIYEAPGTAAGPCFGIDISSGGDAPGRWKRAIIRRNQIYNVGNAGISVSHCQDCVIESNLVVSPLDGGIIYPKNASSGDDLPSARTTVKGNTVYRSDIIVNSGLAATVVEGTGHIVANNVACGTEASVDAISIGSGVTAANNLYQTTCTGLWTNPTSIPSTANFIPSSGSALINAGSSTYTTTAIGVVPWSATDTGKARSTPPDLGAYER